MHVEGFRVKPGLAVGSALVGLISWEPTEKPGDTPLYRHMGTGFLATETGWIVTLKHVIANQPKDATFSILAFVDKGKVTELPVIEGPLFAS